MGGVKFKFWLKVYVTSAISSTIRRHTNGSSGVNPMYFNRDLSYRDLTCLLNYTRF